MKAIYFNSRYELNVNEVNTNAGNTLLFTTVEEFEKIKENERTAQAAYSSIKGEYRELLGLLIQAERNNLLNKKLLQMFKVWL